MPEFWEIYVEVDAFGGGCVEGLFTAIEAELRMDMRGQSEERVCGDTTGAS